MEFPTLGKQKWKFIIGLIIIKANTERLKMVTHYCLNGYSSNKDWDFVIFEHCKHMRN